VSHQVSGVLDVEDPIAGPYDLEVSSPGLDRPLFTAEQFARFIGRKARIRLSVPLAGRRNFSGVLEGVEDNAVLLGEDGVQFRLSLSAIDKARLVPDV
jgi:ribosome maturation factor RimP